MRWLKMSANVVAVEPASTSDETSSDQPERKHLVGNISALSQGQRIHASIDGRYITVLRLPSGAIHAIDSICFHAGGPLGVGEIEDLNGRACLICPWHHYKIDVASGDKYYQGIEWKEGKMIPGDWKSNGIKQRTHSVTIEDNGDLHVTLPPVSAAKIESDGYAFNVPCGERMKGAGGDRNVRGQQATGADGHLPSGHVLQQARAEASAAGLQGSKPL